MRETCYHCLHADFKAEANGTMEKRREKFEEWRNKRK